MEQSMSQRSSIWKWAALALIPLVAVLVVLAGSLPVGGLFGSGPSARAAIARGEELLKTGHCRQALAVVAGIREDGPWKADLLAVRGLALSALGEIEPSRQALETSLALQPSQPMVAKVLAAIYFSRSESVKGIEYLEKAAHMDRGDFRPWYALGEAFVRLGQPEDAAKAFRYALDRKPDHVESQIGLLSILVVTRPPEESVHLLERLLKSRPDDPKVMVLAAWHERALGHAAASLRYADQAVEFDPTLVEAVALRAQLNRATGNSRLALADAERAVELNPNSPAGLNLLAQLQAASGQTESSRATLERHRVVLERTEQIRKLTAEIDKHPEDPQPRWRLGQVAALGGLNNLASQSFQAALTLDPRCQPALEGLRALGDASSRGSPLLGETTSLLPMIRP
jgi:tetratricopeptide (TPR) repeat protein